MKAACYPINVGDVIPTAFWILRSSRRMTREVKPTQTELTGRQTHMDADPYGRLNTMLPFPIVSSIPSSAYWK